MSEKKEYITRAEALLALDSAITAQDAFDNITDIPAADVEPVVRGEWEEDGAITRCSVCGEHKEFPHWTHCPNCGAHLMERSGSGE